MPIDSEVSAADVKIVAMSAVGKRIAHHRAEVTTTIALESDNDDDARCVRCVVVLPPTSHVVSTDPPAAIGPTFPALGPPNQFVQSQPCQGYVVFELTTPMAVGDTEKLELVTHVHESWAERGVGAFVFSNLPDPDPSNNCAFVAVTLPAATEEAAAEA